MEVTRQYVADLLRKTGFPELAEKACRVLPDPVDIDDVDRFLAPYGITRDVLASQMGGSP
jgi:hypothetical protein